MKKFKKIIASAIIAVSIGAIGLTAYAASPYYTQPVYPFSFDMGDDVYEQSGTEFSGPAEKLNNVNLAWALVEYGNPSENFPLYMYVSTKDNASYENHASETVGFYASGNKYEKPLTYLSGKGIKGNTYYLCGFCGEYNIYASGVWAP